MIFLRSAPPCVIHCEGCEEDGIMDQPTAHFHWEDMDGLHGYCAACAPDYVLQYYGRLQRFLMCPKCGRESGVFDRGTHHVTIDCKACGHFHSTYFNDHEETA